MPEGSTTRKRRDNHKPPSGSSQRQTQGTKRNKQSTNSASWQSHAYIVAIVVIALGSSYLHYSYVSKLFENDRFFSHLSSLERQMSFRTEMGLYYSYYKTMVDAPSVMTGLESIVYDNVTEYPSTINVLKRFNLYPELMLGAGFQLYTGFLNMMNMKGKSCFQVSRGHGQPPVESCEGLADEAYFYVTPIFALHGLYVGILFLMSCYLGGGIVGGVLSVAAYFFNHGEGTRVMWSPPLRESFSVPLLFLQILAVTYIIRSRTLTIRHMVLLTSSTVAFMLPWQFAQFVLLTQTLSLFGCYSLRFISAKKMRFFLISLTISLLLNYVLQFFNAMLITSFYCACLLSAWVVVLCQGLFKKLQYFLIIALCQVSTLLALTVASKRAISAVANMADDAHITNLLKAKFTGERDFHSSLYLCAKEFDFIEMSSVLLVTKTLLLPVGGLVILCIFIKVAISVGHDLFHSPAPPQPKEGTAEQSQDAEEEDVDNESADLLYHVLQNLAFLAMAVLIMRLKLFFTPHLCVLAGLLMSDKLFGLVQRHIRAILVVAIGCCMAVQGYMNLQEEMGMIGEFNDPSQEELTQWIQAKTPKNAVFAGSMPLMAAVKLNAYRPIVNHPHYEDVDIRRRTLKVYQIYSRKPPAEIAATLRGMKVDYVILEHGWCTRRGVGAGCSMGEMWDVEDPKNYNRQLFCMTVNGGNIPKPFTQAFSNQVYQVLKVS